MTVDSHSPSHPEPTTSISRSSLRGVPAATDTDSALSVLPVEIQEILSAIDTSSAMFIVLSGPGAGSRFLIDSDTTQLGRDSNSDIFLDDITVSRKHALLRRESNNSVHAIQSIFEIEDLKSLNGTYVNAQPVTKTSLRTGDEVHIGKYRLTFFLGQHKGGK